MLFTVPSQLASPERKGGEIVPAGTAVNAEITTIVTVMPAIRSVLFIMPPIRSPACSPCSTARRFRQLLPCRRYLTEWAGPRLSRHFDF